MGSLGIGIRGDISGGAGRGDVGLREVAAFEARLCARRLRDPMDETTIEVQSFTAVQHPVECASAWCRTPMIWADRGDRHSELADGIIDPADFAPDRTMRPTSASGMRARCVRLLTTERRSLRQWP